jgi:hypothetical protein
VIAAIFPSNFADRRARLGAGLANCAAQLGRLATHLFFDAVQSADASYGFCSDGRCVDHVDIVKLASAMSPTSDFVDRSIAIEMMKSRVGIGLQCTFEVL